MTHLWDPDGVVGQPLLDQFGVNFGGLDYDFFLLFDPDASWGVAAPRPVAAGATVIDSADRLARSAASLLG